MHTHSASTVEGYAGVSPHDEFSPGGSLHTKLPRSEARDALAAYAHDFPQGPHAAEVARMRAP